MVNTTNRLTLIATDTNQTPIPLARFDITGIDKDKQVMVITASDEVLTDIPVGAVGSERGYSVVVTIDGVTHTGFVQAVEALDDGRCYICTIRFR